MTDLYDDEAQITRQLSVARTKDMRRQRGWILEALHVETGHRVLDVGSGNGVFAGELAGIVGESGTVTGADPAPGMVAMARRIAPGAQFVEASATALPFPDESFDRVTAAQVLCFIPDLGTALSEIARVLAPGGRFALLDSDWGTCVWNSPDPDLTARILASYTAPYADAHVVRRLAPGLAAVGLKTIEVTSHVILNRDLSEESYGGQSFRGAVEAATADPAIGADIAESWARGLRALEARGETFFSLNRYVVSGEKP